MNIVTCSKNPKPISRYSSHSHPNWEIVLQLTGCVTTTVNNHTFLFQEGDIMIIPPNTLHSGIADKPFNNIFIEINDADFEDFIVVHDTDSGVHDLMQILHKVLCKQDIDYQILSNSLTASIIQYIKKYAANKSKYPFVAKIQESIYNNLDNPVFDLTTEIKNTGFCSDYFRRCFKEDTGKTPLEYLTEMRISQAKNLLIQNSGNRYSIADIALKCGFQDSFYFSTCFKKHTGVTPSQYRKDNKL